MPRDATGHADDTILENTTGPTSAPDLLVNRSTSDLKELALKLLADGPLKIEKTSRRVRALLDGIWLVDTTSAFHVWEHPYYPQFYVPTSDIPVGYHVSNAMRKSIDKDGFAWLEVYKGLKKRTYRVLSFRKGKLAGLTRFDFAEMDAWFEEDQPIYQHPRDPYKRIDILPSIRRVQVEVYGLIIADSTSNMFLFETMLQPRYYMPKTAIAMQRITPSSKVTICPYKGTAEYYNIEIGDREIKNALWWYRHPTRESALIEGMACFYSELADVNVFLDGMLVPKNPPTSTYS
ncbi:MAG: hypothetical protein Q9166_006369 [cf. Caloplaca sp. 2 TL-2023]